MHHTFLRLRWKFPPSSKLTSYSVIAADTLRDLVTLTFDLLTLFNGHTWRVTWSTPPLSLKILRLSVLEWWVLTSPMQPLHAHAPYHVTCVGANFSRIFVIRDPDLPIRCTTFMALRLRQMELSSKTVYGPVLKSMYSSLRMRKIASALNAAVNHLPPSFSATTISP